MGAQPYPASPQGKCRADGGLEVIEDRSMRVQPHEIVCVEWVDIDRCVLGSRVRMNPEAVERKFRKLLQQGEAASWPPIVGHWSGGSDADRARFVVDDGRHELLAALMIGRAQVLVAWIEKRPGIAPGPS